MGLTLLRLPDVRARLGLANTLLYDWAKKGLLPPPVKITERCSAWPLHEVDAIAASLIRGDSDAQRRALVSDLVRRRRDPSAAADAPAAPFAPNPLLRGGIVPARAPSRREQARQARKAQARR